MYNFSESFGRGGSTPEALILFFSREYSNLWDQSLRPEFEVDFDKKISEL